MAWCKTTATPVHWRWGYCIPVTSPRLNLRASMRYLWPGARLQQLRWIGNGVTAVLLQAIDKHNLPAHNRCLIVIGSDDDQSLYWELTLSYTAYMYIKIQKNTHYTIYISMTKWTVVIQSIWKKTMYNIEQSSMFSARMHTCNIHSDACTDTCIHRPHIYQWLCIAY